MMERQTCDICGKRVKNLKLHKLRAHPETSGEAQPEPELKQFGINLDQVKPFITPIVASSVQEVLNSMNIPNIISEAVNRKVDSLVSQYQQQAQQQVQSSAPAAAANAQPQAVNWQNVPPWAQPILTGIGQRLTGGGGSFDLSKMVEVQKNMASLVELHLAPYSRGRGEAFKEMNELFKLAKGAGMKPKDIIHYGEEHTKLPEE